MIADIDLLLRLVLHPWKSANVVFEKAVTYNDTLRTKAIHIIYRRLVISIKLYSQIHGLWTHHNIHNSLS